MLPINTHQNQEAGLHAGRSIADKPSLSQRASLKHPSSMPARLTWPSFPPIPLELCPLHSPSGLFLTYKGIQGLAS